MAECYQAESRLACLAEYVQRLRADGWREAQIEELETKVRHLLKAIVVQDEDDLQGTLTPVDFG